jgi:hypothetical protein
MCVALLAAGIHQRSPAFYSTRYPLVPNPERIGSGLL